MSKKYIFSDPSYAAKTGGHYLNCIFIIIYIVSKIKKLFAAIKVNL